MRRIVAFLVFLISAVSAFGQATPSMTVAQINTAINSAAVGSTFTFAAGTYTINSPINIKCGITYQGPVIAIPTNGIPTGQTAILNNTQGTQGNVLVASNQSCTQTTTVQFFQINNAGFGIHVSAPFPNLVIQYNYITSIPCDGGCTGNNTGGLWFDGPTQSAYLTNITVQWNQIGDANSCTQEFSIQNGGQCNGIGMYASVNGFYVLHNNFYHVGEGFHIFCPNYSGTSYPCEPAGDLGGSGGAITRNFQIYYNDFSNIHRIGVEEQPQESSGIDHRYNTMHDWNTPDYGSYGFSMACCSNGTHQQPWLNVTDNLVLFNTLGTSRYGYGMEAMGFNQTYSYNLIQLGNPSQQPNYPNGSPGIAWGNGGVPQNGPYTYTYNYVCGLWGGQGGPVSIGNGAAYISSEGGGVPNDSYTPSLTGSVAAASCSAIQSASPSISPAAGSQSFPLTVTLTDNGLSGTAAARGNTGIWYTTDGSTPIPGSGTAKRVDSGGTFVMSSAATVKAVGMWGAANQPTSYPSGFGFTPSPTVSAAYTSGPCTGPNNSVPITNAGAVGDGTTDNTTAINNAISTAKTNGCSVEVPAAASSFAHSGLITLNGVSMFGIGPQSILKATNASTSAIILTGTAPSLSNLVIQGTGTSRNTGPNQAGVYINGATGYTVTNVLISGGSAPGIWSIGGANGTESNNTVQNTLADSITQTNGANHILVQNNLVINSGDDGISNNSYTTDSNTVNNITINANAIMRNANARGLEVSGGSNITFTNNYVDNLSGYACMALLSEGSPGAYSTQAVTSPVVTGNTFVNCGPNQGSLFMWVESSSNTITNAQVNNNRWNAGTKQTFTANQVEGPGTITGSTISNSSAYIGSVSFLANQCSPTSNCNLTQTSNTTSSVASYPGPLNPITGGTIPLFSLPAGTYSYPQTLTLTEITSGDTISYCSTTSTTCTPATNYTGPITVSSAMTICAVGINSSSASPVTSANTCVAYTGGPAPTLTNGFQGNGTGTPGTGVNTLAVGAAAVQQIAFGNYSDGSVHSLPDAYGNTAAFASSAPTILQVTSSGMVSCLAPGTANSTASASPGGQAINPWGWTCTGATPAATPTFTPAAESFTGTVNVSIATTTSGATIYYTTDGSTPTTSSATYSSPIAVSATTTIRAIATATGFSQSAVGSSTYTLLTQTATPTFNPVSGAVFTGSLSVSIADSTAGASIYYTTDGSTPTTASTLYTGAFNITSTTTVKAIATASGFTQSAVGTASYTASTNVIVSVSLSVLGNQNYVIVGGTAQFAAVFTYADATTSTNTTVGVNDSRGNHITSWNLTNHGGNGTISNAGVFTGTALGAVQVNANQTGAVATSTPWFEYVSQSATNKSTGIKMSGVTIP